MASTDQGAGVRTGSTRGVAGPELALARQSSGQQTGADSRQGLSGPDASSSKEEQERAR